MTIEKSSGTTKPKRNPNSYLGEPTCLSNTLQHDINKVKEAKEQISCIIEKQIPIAKKYTFLKREIDDKVDKFRKITWRNITRNDYFRKYYWKATVKDDQQDLPEWEINAEDLVVLPEWLTAEFKGKINKKDGVQDVIIDVKGEVSEQIKIILEIKNGKMKVTDTINYIYKQFISITTEYIQEFCRQKPNLQKIQNNLDTISKELWPISKFQNIVINITPRNNFKDLRRKQELIENLKSLLGILKSLQEHVDNSFKYEYNEESWTIEDIWYRVRDLDFAFDKEDPNDINNIDLSDPYTAAEWAFNFDRNLKSMREKLYNTNFIN